MSKTRRQNQLCTVGASGADGVIELLGGAFMIYVTPQTEVAPGLELKLGHKVLVDYDYRKGAERQVAERVRELGPAAGDFERFRRFEAVLEQAGLEAAVRFGDVEPYLKRRWAEGASTAELPVDPLREFDARMSAAVRRYPMTWWHDQPEAGVDEMVDEFLEPRGLDERFPAARILEACERRLDEETPSSEGTLSEEQLERRYTVGMIVAAANALFEEAGLTERFFPFADYEWEEQEPVWYLLTPTQATGLLRGGALKPAGELEAEFSPSTDVAPQGLPAELETRPLEPKDQSFLLRHLMLGTAMTGFLVLGASGGGAGYFAAAAGVAALWFGRVLARRRK